MQDIQPELVERYQILLQRDPKSQVFAPLAEAYRKMGLLEEAFRIAVRGVQFNPTFAGGRIALAKIFLDRDGLASATEELEKAVECSAENIMAHALLADCYLKAKRPKEALRAFKMVLFLAPTNERALRAVQKLEALTADEYEDDLFQMKPLETIGTITLKPPAPTEPSKLAGELERVLSLVDAYIVRNDTEKARLTLGEAENNFGAHPEVINTPPAHQPEDPIRGEFARHSRRAAFTRGRIAARPNQSPPLAFGARAPQFPFTSPLTSTIFG